MQRKNRMKYSTVTTLLLVFWNLITLWYYATSQPLVNGSQAPIAASPLLPPVDYDIVYVRTLRRGDDRNTVRSEATTPVSPQVGTDLMLLHPDGAEEVLFSAGPDGAVMNPSVSYDAQSVAFWYFPNVRPLDQLREADPTRTSWRDEAGIYRVDLVTRALTRLTLQQFTPDTRTQADAVDGIHFEPFFGFGTLAHPFITRLSDGSIVVCQYGRSGFGQLYRFPMDGTGQPGYPLFQPTALDNVSSDELMRVGLGAFAHLSAAPNNELLVVYARSPVNDNATNTGEEWAAPDYDSGIYRLRGDQVLNRPEDLVLVKDDPHYNELWPRAVVPYQRIYGIEAPINPVDLTTDGRLDPRLSEDAPLVAKAEPRGSTPNLTITVEPSESGSVVYLPLAAKTTNHQPNGQLALKLTIKNNETAKVHVNQLVVTFIGSPSVNPVTIPMDLEIAANSSQEWFFSTQQNIILPVPAPGQIKLGLSADGFTSPAIVTKPLAAHKSPTPAGSYRFPARASDLRVGEYWSGRSAAHSPAGGGSQLFAYDMGVITFDQATNKWTDLLPGKSADKNESYRVWGKPIYAMADGTVVAFRNDIPTNPNPPEDLSPPNPVEGNHFYLQHGDELVLYAHFQPGSLNAKLMQVGAQVKAGTFLGLAGNSGNSTAPHLHIHAIRATKPWSGPLRPLPFHDIYVIDHSVLNPPNPAGPWVKVNGQGLPNVASAIWPVASKPSWYPPGWAELSRHGIPAAAYQTEFERIASSGYRLVWIDGYDVNGQTFFNVIFRPADGTAWVAQHDLDGSEYQEEFNKWIQQGFRLAHIESYLSGGQIRYASIFVKSPGPQWAAYHGRTAEQHQQLFNNLTQDGFRPVNISAVSLSGTRYYAALYEKRDVGSFVSRSFLTPAEYQTEFDSNVQAGRKLVYLNAYTHLGSPRIIAIWYQKAASPFVARHGLSSTQYQTEHEKQLANGFLTRAVTGYEEGDQARFAALWSK